MAYAPYYGSGFGQVFDFRYVIQQWMNVGVFDVLLPMVLIFAIIYAVLQKSKILGEHQGINAIVALVIAFLTIGNPYVTNAIVPLFSNIGLGILIIVGILLMVGLVVKEEWAWGKIGICVVAVVAIWSLSRAADFYEQFYGGGIFGMLPLTREWWLMNSYWIIPLVLIGVLIAVVIGGGKIKKTPIETIWDMLGLSKKSFTK